MTLASYASNPLQSRGRLYKEPEDVMRSVFQRDRDRIIHCAAFRRLEYKTQVFVNHEGDHYRTRLTHSLEVAQLARSISRSLDLNEDLAEALALAHDLGHTPFGHAGEDALKEVMQDFGGFDHNAQTLRVLTKLEHRYADFDGLNLTWETLEGIVKHNGPVTQPPRAMAEYIAMHDLEIHSYASAEAQIASLSDDIAYNNHDIEDGLRSGLFSIEDICHVAFVSKAFEAVKQKYPALQEKQRIIHEAIRRMVNAMVYDLIHTTKTSIGEFDVTSVSDIRNLNKPVVVFSPEMEKNIAGLKQFLMKNMYRHYKVNRMSSKARHILKSLFTFYLEESECMPTQWQYSMEGKNAQGRAEIVADFIAGMTDRFATNEYEKIFMV